MPAEARVCIVGLGSIGRDVLVAARQRTSLRVVAAADPAFAGRDAGEVAGLPPLGVTVQPSAQAAFREPADVALVLTSSGVADVAPVLMSAVEAGQNVVSTCEDLAFAEWGSPALAASLDAAARARGVTVLGTGVNPGFVMDRLPLMLAGACVRVDRVRVERVLDAARRRGPLRAKVGADLTEAEFRQGVAAGRLGHRGLVESCALVGAGLGVPFDEIRSRIEPVLSTDAAPRPGIGAGRVAGLRQAASGIRSGEEVVRLDLEMSVGAPDPRDRIVIAGDPPLDVVIAGGTHGDRGTVGAVLNAIVPVIGARPGLLRVIDLALYGAGS